MNDNTLLEPDDFPDWVWDIVERHDLGSRTDSPLCGATVLLSEAADDLTELSRTVFQEQALTAETQRRAAACAAMITDALALAEFCPSEAAGGVVTEAEDGTLTWSPDPPVDETC